MRAILTYHSIDDSGSPISISASAFTDHVRWLSSGRVRVLPLQELLRDTHTEDCVAITFDDAFENFATEAWPRLRAHGLPVTVFVVTQRVGRTNAWGGHDVEGIPTLPLLGWDALDRLRAEGVEIGGHTRTHARLSSLGAGHTMDEVAGCRHDIQVRYGSAPIAFAYPYGDAPAHAQRIVLDGFACGCTTAYGPLSAAAARELLPRLDMFYFRRPGAFAGWGTLPFRARIGARRAARAVRAAAARHVER